MYVLIFMKILLQSQKSVFIVLKKVKDSIIFKIRYQYVQSSICIRTRFELLIIFYFESATCCIVRKLATSIRHVCENIIPLIIPTQFYVCTNKLQSPENSNSLREHIFFKSITQKPYDIVLNTSCQICLQQIHILRVSCSDFCIVLLLKLNRLLVIV